jgi:asparagine N-glycosylation enzyme membrane subunit Stt3
MVTLFILLLVLGIVMICVTGACVFLLDPIIAVLAIMAVYKLVKRLCSRKKK